MWDAAEGHCLLLRFMSYSPHSTRVRDQEVPSRVRDRVTLSLSLFFFSPPPQSWKRSSPNRRSSNRTWSASRKCSTTSCPWHRPKSARSASIALSGRRPSTPGSLRASCQASDVWLCRTRVSLLHAWAVERGGGRDPLDFEILYFLTNFLVEKHFSPSFELVKWNFTTVVPLGENPVAPSPWKNYDPMTATPWLTTPWLPHESLCADLNNCEVTIGKMMFDCICLLFRHKHHRSNGRDKKSARIQMRQARNRPWKRGTLLNGNCHYFQNGVSGSCLAGLKPLKPHIKFVSILCAQMTPDRLW